MKAKQLNEGKYSNIIEFLNDYVNNTQNAYDSFKERNGPSERYDDRQINIMKYYESLVKKSTSVKIGSSQIICSVFLLTFITLFLWRGLVSHLKFE
jgi:hypothetical protein